MIQLEVADNNVTADTKRAAAAAAALSSSRPSRPAASQNIVPHPAQQPSASTRHDAINAIHHRRHAHHSGWRLGPQSPLLPPVDRSGPGRTDNPLRQRPLRSLRPSPTPVLRGKAMAASIRCQRQPPMAKPSVGPCRRHAQRGRQLGRSCSVSSTSLTLSLPVAPLYIVVPLIAARHCRQSCRDAKVMRACADSAPALVIASHLSRHGNSRIEAHRLGIGQR